MHNEPWWIIPVALLLMGIEVSVDLYLKRDSFEVRDTIASFAISFMTIAATLLSRGMSFAVLFAIYDLSVFKISNAWYNWLLALILVDFLAYWFHWLGHHSRFFWIAHAPHHSSERFNLTTAIRTPVFNACFRFFFWTPLCLIGFPPAMIISVESFIFIYQFFIHTEMIGKLGWLENIFNTPSHHRVHHGTNEAYVDKNFGGILIIWDRLLGTFQLEKEKVKYGVLNRKATCNPFRIVFMDWYHLLAHLAVVRSLPEFFKVLFGPPSIGMTSASGRIVPVQADRQETDGERSDEDRGIRFCEGVRDKGEIKG
jgi:sterol desaturase/sphingolipid hydroxylase (fatty acid hydroxylase superfamily)